MRRLLHPIEVRHYRQLTLRQMKKADAILRQVDIREPVASGRKMVLLVQGEPVSSVQFDDRVWLHRMATSNHLAEKTKCALLALLGPRRSIAELLLHSVQAFGLSSIDATFNLEGSQAMFGLEDESGAVRSSVGYDHLKVTMPKNYIPELRAHAGWQDAS